MAGITPLGSKTNKDSSKIVKALGYLVISVLNFGSWEKEEGRKKKEEGRRKEEGEESEAEI
ncbi:hypothetical protein KEJ36_04250 [Candidatus Bathyarchaeota archaeon]|nr:hypothetical protein [Candidatus Bathyarchaeota archaeon]